MKALLPVVFAVCLAEMNQDSKGPSDADAKKAELALAINVDDPEANLVMGKYFAFTKTDWEKALPYLSKGSDPTLKSAAQKDLSGAQTATEQAALGNEWIAALKKHPKERRFIEERAGLWYSKAWPELEPASKAKLRELSVNLSAARPTGGQRKGLPGNWKSDLGAPVLDGAVARTGSYSIRMPGDPKTETFIKSDLIQLPPTAVTIEYSAWIRSDGTDSANDQVGLNYFDKDGRLSGTAGAGSPVDVPFWNLVAGKSQIPKEASSVKIVVALRSKKGNLWVDDMSLRMDGKELLKNGSFEDK